MIFTIPNLISALRIAAVPVFLWLLFGKDDPATAGWLLGGLGATDWLDGWLARRLGQTSPLGAFLDPVADKLMVAIALVLLVQSDPRIVLALPAAVIIGREITVSALREWMAEVGARSQVAVSMAGKLKTTAQMIAIVLLILHAPVLGLPVLPIGLVLIYIAAALTLWSMLLYMRAAWPSLTATHTPQAADTTHRAPAERADVTDGVRK